MHNRSVADLAGRKSSAASISSSPCNRLRAVSRLSCTTIARVATRTSELLFPVLLPYQESGGRCCKKWQLRRSFFKGSWVDGGPTTAERSARGCPASCCAFVEVQGIEASSAPSREKKIIFFNYLRIPRPFFGSATHWSVSAQLGRVGAMSGPFAFRPSASGGPRVTKMCVLKPSLDSLTRGDRRHPAPETCAEVETAIRERLTWRCIGNHVISRVHFAAKGRSAPHDKAGV